MDDLEKRGLIAVALSLGFLLLWSTFFSPPPPEPEAPAGAVPGEIGSAPGSLPTGVPEGAGTVGPETAGSEISADPGLATPPEVAAVAAEQEEEIVVRTDLYEITLTNRGGRVLSWKLLDYFTTAGDPVELVPPAARDLDQLPLSVWVAGREDLGQRASDALFQVDRDTVSAGGGRRAQQVRMVFREASGFLVEKTLRLTEGEYFVDASVSMREGGRELPAWLTWGAGFGETAEGDVKATRFLHVGGVIVNRAGDVTRFRKEKEDEPLNLDGPTNLNWAGMETTYFAALMIPNGPSRQAALFPSRFQPETPPGEEKAPKPVSYLSVALAPGAAEGRPEGAGDADYRLFVGPKDYRLLRSSGHDLKGAINFGWPVIREIAQGLYIGLTWVYSYVGNYGIAILVLTFAIRLGFFPIMYRTQIKMRHMQVKTKRIQPKMKAIRERYRKQGSDFQSKQKMNEEIMALYKKEGVNPLGGLGGCLPLLLQLPFLYGFYQLLNSTIELRQAPFFGWIQDLSLPDPYYVTPLLMGASMLVQTKISMSSAVDPNQRRMMTMMSVVFTVFFLNLPSGLVLYWLFSNLLGIGQQVLVNRRADHEIELHKPQKKSKSSKKDNPDGEKNKKPRAASRP